MNMKLISVNDRLPKINQIVVARNDKGYMGFGFFDGIKWRDAFEVDIPKKSKKWFQIFEKVDKGVCVTHWVSFDDNDQPERLSEKTPKGDAIV